MKNRGRAGDELADVIKTKIVAGQDTVMVEARGNSVFPPGKVKCLFQS